MRNITKYLGGQTMKKNLLFIAALGALALTSCTTTNQTRAPYDDVYYSSKDASAPAQTSADQYSQDGQQNASQDYTEKRSPQPDYTNTEKSGGDTYITNNYYNSDDYYDYAYSSRLRRFYSPSYYGGYYDPYYTNLYWYDYNPYSWGVSIYVGYNWWAPSWYYYDPFCYGYYSFHRPWYPYSHYWPYGYGYGWNNYGWGYNHGYYNGYWNGYWDGYYAGNWYGNNYYYNNPYYYNSYDNNSYYGPRGTQSSNNNTASSSGQQNYSQFKSIGQIYQSQIAMEKTGLPAMPAKGSGDISTGNKVSSSPVDKGVSAGKETVTPALNNNSSKDNSVKQGNTGNAVLDNYTTPSNKAGKEVETSPKQGNAAAGTNPVDQYTTRPSTPVQNNAQENRQNSGSQGQGNVKRGAENNTQQRSNTQAPVPNSNSRTQEPVRREYSFPQRETEQPVQRDQRQENRVNTEPDNNRSQSRDGYSRYAPSQEYSYPQRRTEENRQNRDNYERRSNDSQPRNNEYRREAPQRQEPQRNYERNNYERRQENRQSAPSQPQMEQRQAPAPRMEAPRQSTPAPQYNAPRNDSRSNNNSGGGRRR